MSAYLDKYYPPPGGNDGPPWFFLGLLILILVLTAACTPLTPYQRELHRSERLRDTVEYCESRGGSRECWRVPRSQVERILRGTP